MILYPLDPQSSMLYEYECSNALYTPLGTRPRRIVVGLVVGLGGLVGLAVLAVLVLLVVLGVPLAFVVLVRMTITI